MYQQPFTICSGNHHSAEFVWKHTVLNVAFESFDEIALDTSLNIDFAAYKYGMRRNYAYWSDPAAITAAMQLHGHADRYIENFHSRVGSSNSIRTLELTMTQRPFRANRGELHFFITPLISA